ncbi:MAG: hypothetical protein LH645_14035 [Actinomycetia bacterium]|nr:hypothetical protein [Actinomycetes bacterium]
MFPPVPASLTRRRLLLGAVGAPLLLSIGACTDDPPVDLPTDPDRAALEAAQEVEAATRASLEGWPASADYSAVTPADASAVVSAHISALATALSMSPAALPSPSGSEPDVLRPTLSTSEVVAVLDAAASDHTRALRTASPEISPLLASIAASDATLATAILRSNR